jgi:hypothetical protein
VKRTGDDSYELSTGRQIDANNGLIGLRRDPETNQFLLSEGYDSIALIGYAADKNEPDVWDEWTAAELAELADFMIEEWQRFKNELGRE